MKILPKTFKKNGFEFEQIKREGNVAIYRKRQQHWKTSRYTYETIIIKPMKGGEVFGKVIEPYEAYPTSEQWGVNGWADRTLDAAYQRAAGLETVNA